MRDLAVLVGLFLAAVALSLLLHPLAGLVFLALAKVVSMLWADGVEAYRATLAEDRVRPKRKHILTDDGEQLNVITDKAETPRERLLR